MRINASVYACLFIVFLLGWPLKLVDLFGWLGGLGPLIVNTIIFFAVVYFTSSSELSFWRGLRFLPCRYMSGCANITILYIFFILAFHYICMVVAMFIGIRKGKSYTENWWLQYVQSCTGIARGELIAPKYSEDTNSSKGEANIRRNRTHWY
jgi:hypothetical protein